MEQRNLGAKFTKTSFPVSRRTRLNFDPSSETDVLMVGCA
jgi:hypothetical protein